MEVTFGERQRDREREGREKARERRQQARERRERERGRGDRASGGEADFVESRPPLSLKCPIGSYALP